MDIITQNKYVILTNYNTLISTLYRVLPMVYGTYTFTVIIITYLTLLNPKTYEQKIIIFSTVHGTI